MMIKSMTGYGRCQQTIDGRDIIVEIRSVNHRYFEFSARVPRAYGFLEEKLKSFVQSLVSRGKIEVGVTIVNLGGATTDVQVNHQLAEGYLAALRELGSELSLKDDIGLSAISRFGDIFAISKAPEDEEQVWNAVQKVASQAVSSFVDMRLREGKRMETDLTGRLEAIEQSLARVEEKSPQTVENYRNRLMSKLTELLEGSSIDEQRVLTECAIFAEKIAVAEETVRLSSHIHQFREILSLGEPAGRKLDFLVQEFNREVNTIGSKAQDTEIARLVIEMKSDIEKLREQIQNIE